MDSFDEMEMSDGSDFGSVTKPKPKAKKPTAALSKPTAKKAPKAATSKPKAVIPKKRSKKDTEDEDSEPDRENIFDDESLLSSTPPKAKKAKTTTVKPGPRKSLSELVNENMNVDGVADVAKPKKAKRVSEQYQMLTQIEHIIKRPDTYIGSVERTEKQMWVYNTTSDMMEFREVSFVPGLFKIFDEILVNAADNKQNDKNMDEMQVTVDREKGMISVYNNGRGIPIEIHSKEQIYIPEMIFGRLLSSSNYDDDQEKVTGGRNGYGAKLANIYSTEFTVETADSRHKKQYKQTWTNNMGTMEKAKINDFKGEDFTKVTFYPDFAKFGMSKMDDDFEALAKRRVYDLAGTLKDVNVKLNGSRVPVRSFKKYMELYTKAIKKERGDEAADDVSEIITERPNPRWEIGFAVSDGSFQQVSFVNAIATTSGGTHVNYISDQICNKLADIVKKKNKGGAQLKVNQIRNHIFLFVNCSVVNPAFTSQTKEQLTTKAARFGSTCNISDAFLKKIQSTKVIDNILHFAQQKADQILKKSDGSRRSRMTNPKLVDANKAGTKDGHTCTLILTEGDSAKGLAMAGRAVVGPDLFGVFPLRGKLLNVRDASIDQISKNAEIQNIKNFLGLQHKKIYTDTKGLRYGHLMIMTDQDHDGSHIKGLLINFLQVQFPSLLKLPGFLVEFITPIVKVWKGDPKRPTHTRAFFTMPEYLAFKEAHQNEKWEHKYYKGLGTSSTEEAQKYFNDIDKHHKEFATLKEDEEQLIDLAFSKKKADERKEWLRQCVPGAYLDHSAQKITYTDFVNKELILFSMADNIRSIPSVVDGLKPGQRKVLYSCFKRNLKKDMKVVELAGYVSGLTAYQHGETSLQQTIVGLAQTFVGSNNVNYLEPSGNFGSRLQGGSDAASARYIYTRLSPFARKLFHAADEPLLTYNTDDDRTIEPEIYAPVLPLVLINGADGIGTGWSTSIPNYNPIEVAENLRRMMDGEECQPMQPWFRGFKGEVAPEGTERYKFSGKLERSGDNEVQITELPIRVWTQDFKDKLEEIIKAEKTPSFIKDYKDYNTHQDVHFVIQLEDKYVNGFDSESLETKFKLSKTMATSNLVAFDPEGRIHKYASVEDIMKEFFAYRLKMYQKRKDWLLGDLNRELKRFTNQMRFIQMIIDGKLIISKKKKAVLVAELKKLGFDAFPKIKDASKAGELEEIAENEDEEASEDERVDASAYDYLLGMALWSLTQERVDKLRKHIGDKEVEIDELMKLRKEDLWKRDLDEFVHEWHLQLTEEKQRQKGIVKGRRTSKKFVIGNVAPAVRKRKGLGDALDDDSDFELAAAKPKKPAVVKQSVITNFVSGPKVNPLAMKPKPFDGGSSDIEPVETAPTLPAVTEPEKKATKSNGTSKPSKATSSRPKAKPIEIKEDSDFDAQPSKSRNQRAATKKTNYAVNSDSEDENGDDLLGDVSLMVRNLAPKAGSTTESKPIFATSFSRPSSSQGIKPVTKPAKDIMNIPDDETDYKSLAPIQSPRRSLLVTRKENNDMDLNDDSDDDVVPPNKPIAKAVKPKAKKAAEKDKGKPKKAPVPKATSDIQKDHQSPVAKAYAKRLAKKKVTESDDEDAMAHDILDSPSEGDQPDSRPVDRPARRAAAARRPVMVDDDDSDDFGASSDRYSD